MKRFWFGLLTVVALAFGSAPALADARSDYMIRLLREGSMFRVRAQAALNLARLGRSDEGYRALTTALGDEHPAVRIAAISALVSWKDIRALDRVRTMVSADREDGVRRAARTAVRSLETEKRRQETNTRQVAEGVSSASRFYITLGGVTASGGLLLTDAIRGQIRREMIGRLGAFDEELLVAPEGESLEAVTRRLSQEPLRGVYIAISLQSVEARPDGSVRAQASAILQTYPGREVRSMLTGTATATGGARDAAIVAACGATLRGLSTALGAWR